MKWFLAVAAVALSAMVASPALAQEGKGGKGNRGPRRGGEDFRKQMLERFDKDGDGKLSDEERAAARAEFEKRRGAAGGEGRGPGGRGPGGPGRPGGPNQEEMLKRFDKDGDGKLSDEERAAARQQFEERRKEAMKKFDKDGDGELNEEERQALRESFRANRPEGGKKAE